MFSLTSVFLVAACLVMGLKAEREYIKQKCHSSDPKVTNCIAEDLYHLRPWLATGIPEIKMPSIEPFRIPEISLSLSTGPQGYKITLKDMDIFSASNFTVSKIKFQENGKPFETRLKIPHMKILARYTSSGVLFIIPASGNGTFQAVFDGVNADLRGFVMQEARGGEKYLSVDNLDVDLKIKTLKMQVKKIFNNNRILIEATNLFLRENGQEVLKAMLPQLKAQLSKEFKRIVNALLVNVPLSEFYVED